METGFASCTSSLDLKLIDDLVEETVVIPKTAVSGLTHTQKERENQLDEIDAAMEDLIDDIELSEDESEVKQEVEVKEEAPVIQQSLANVLGELEEDEDVEIP